MIPRLRSGQAAAVASPDRKGYLDWLRGVGVLIMIQGHVIDAWTAAAERTRTAYHWISFVGGLAGTPIFLLLAGVALALGAGARMRRGRSEHEVAALARRRGWQIFGLAFLFRLQSWVISGGSPWTLLKVDILNVMGVAMIAAALLWGAGRGRWSRAALLTAAAVAAAMVTPLVRAAGWVAVLPDPIEAYLRPAPNMTTFTLLPWAGFVFAGAAVGAWLDAARTAREERLVALGLGIGGVAVALGGYAASLLPPIYAQTNFWTSSPTFFFVRLGVVIALVPVAYLWNGLSGRSWLCEFGRSSLFVYWIHVEMAYGVVSLALHRRLPLEQAYLGFILLTALLFTLVRLKKRVKTGLRPQGDLSAAVARGLTVDGIPTSHLLHSVHGVPDGGSIAMVNSDAIGSLSLLPGSYPQHTGRRIGAQVEIAMRKGDRERFRARAGLSGTSASMTLTRSPLGSPMRKPSS